MITRMLNVFSLVVLSLTFIAILWYSWETRELRKETAKLREWQKRQAQLSVIHMEMNRMISEHANGPQHSPGYLMKRYYIAQKKVIQEEDFDIKNLFSSTWEPQD